MWRMSVSEQLGYFPKTSIFVIGYSVFCGSVMPAGKLEILELGLKSFEKRVRTAKIEY